MTAISSPSPVLFSVLSSTPDQNEDFLTQLRSHLTRIETNVQQTLSKIQERAPFTFINSNSRPIDDKIRNKFFNVLKDVASKNNLPFDESNFRREILENNNSTASPQVDVIQTKSVPANESNDQHLSPVNQTRRSQFAPVLSSTPVHQTSPNIPIPVDITMTTPAITTVFTTNSTDLPPVPPSAIVPQRANLVRGGNRPPRLPRGDSATRQKTKPSPIKEQQIEEEIVISGEIRLTSKRRIHTSSEVIEDTVQVVLEKQDEKIAEMIKQVHATPLRGRKKKLAQEEVIPIEPEPVLEVESRPKSTRAGRSKKKEVEAKPTTLPTRASSVRSRKKPEIEEEPIVTKDPSPPPPKKTTRSRKKTDNPPEEIAPAKKPRGKKKTAVETVEPAVSPSPKKPTTRTRKRKGNEEQQENTNDNIKPPSPKRRAGRQMKSMESSPALLIPEPATPEVEIPAPTVRSSRRGKKDIEVPILKQDEIVLKKKSRSGREKKTDNPPPVLVDVVMTSVTTVSAPIPTSASMDSLVNKPPRPPVARKKKSIAMPPISQVSPTTPPSSSQRIQSTSPVNTKPILPLPSLGRRRAAGRQGASSPTRFDVDAETLPPTTKSSKRTRSSVATTPKRSRKENLVITSVVGTPGKKRNKCTCEKRRNRTCDICAAALDA